MFEVRPRVPAVFCHSRACCLQKYVAPILMGYLSGFIQNLPDLKLSMWQGNVVLKNLQIREGAFAELLPFRIVGGWIQELHITIPWSSLTSTPVQVRSLTLCRVVPHADLR
jgi:hypothetical protein